MELHHLDMTDETQESEKTVGELVLSSARTVSSGGASDTSIASSTVSEAGEALSTREEAENWAEHGIPSRPVPPQTQRINEIMDQESLRDAAPTTHFFMGHRQKDAGARVGELVGWFRLLGLQCWRDQSGSNQDLTAMVRGVATASVYTLFLTKRALAYLVAGGT